MSTALSLPSDKPRRPAPRAAARAVVVAAFAGLTMCAAPAAAQTTYGADHFVDSVGVNVHLHYMDTLYHDFDLVRAQLIELGVRHVRDGLIDTAWQPYYDRHNSLGRAGIKGVFIADAVAGSTLLQQYPSRMADAFEAYEAPNEYNLSGDANWPSTLRGALTRLRDLRRVPALAGFPVIGPSLTQAAAYAALGDVSALVDAGNLHNYFAGHHPGTTGWGSNGYGSIDWNLALVRGISGSRPIITTETGYWTDLATRDAVPAAIMARYMPRMLLEQYRRGIARTYIYELIDFPTAGLGGTSGYGLIERDGSRKPGYHAVRALLALLGDPGPAFTPSPFAYAVQGGTTTLRHMAFRKRDGRAYLALWLEAAAYDVNTRSLLTVASQAVTVTTGGGARLAATHQWRDDGQVTRTAASSSGAIPLSVSDRLLILEFDAPAVPAPPINLRLVP